MTVEQVLKVLEDMKAMLDERQAHHLANAEMYEANARRMEERNPTFYKGNIIACREWSAQQNERAADCAEKKRYIDHAIAIIKAAKAVAEDASVAMHKEGGTPQFCGVGRVAMERLLSLLSPEQ